MQNDPQFYNMFPKEVYELPVTYCELKCGWYFSFGEDKLTFIFFT